MVNTSVFGIRYSWLTRYHFIKMWNSLCVFSWIFCCVDFVRMLIVHLTLFELILVYSPACTLRTLTPRWKSGKSLAFDSEYQKQQHWSNGLLSPAFLKERKGDYKIFSVCPAARTSVFPSARYNFEGRRNAKTDGSIRSILSSMETYLPLDVQQSSHWPLDLPVPGIPIEPLNSCEYCNPTATEQIRTISTQIAKFMGPTWGPMLTPWTLLLG